ncbi:MAG TPA: amidoligase family protein [Xanthomonadales bacterium]|nr:amidoligase family protein [Xanthomonadales bacterium]
MSALSGFMPLQADTLLEAAINTTTWNMPAITSKTDGSSRQVGVEIELQGIGVDDLAVILRDAIGGEIRQISRSEYELDVPGQGSYRIEVDYALLKQIAREEAQGSDSGNPPQEWLVEALDSLSSMVVPCEIVSPPIAMEKIDEPMDAIVEVVRQAGAKGTRASIAYAFGVHLNVEPPDMRASTILSYLRAFVCLYDWIIREGKVDLSRRVTPYINSFPRDYEKLILAPDYQPEFSELIADYLEHNATRNRALDMLPLFSSVEEKTISDRVDDDRVKARPAFHYRLENSCVDEPGWSVAKPWNRWHQIEKLAADEAALEQLCTELLSDANRLLHPIDNRWLKKVQVWVEQS